MSAKRQSRQLQAHIPPQKCWRTSRKCRTNFVRTVENCQRFTATEWTLNQEKGNVKLEEKLCGVLTGPCFSAPQLSHHLEDCSLPSPGGSSAHGSRGIRVNHVCKILCMCVWSCLGPPEGPKRCKVSASLSSGLTQGRKAADTAWKHYKVNNLQLRGQKWLLKHTRDHLEQGRRSLGKTLFGMLGHSKAPMHMGGPRRPCTCPKQDG